MHLFKGNRLQECEVSGVAQKRVQLRMLDISRVEMPNSDSFSYQHRPNTHIYILFYFTLFNFICECRNIQWCLRSVIVAKVLSVCLSTCFIFETTQRIYS
jgi:hypothetical protein